MTFQRRLPASIAIALSLGISALYAHGSAASEAGPIKCTVILDEETGDVLHRDGTCDRPFSPMSTFKFPLAIMGYDANLLVDAHAPSWDYKPEFNRGERERKTTDPAIWMKESIVWYSQEITRKLGDRRFGDYVKRFGYGNADVSGRPGKNDGLTESWLMSSLEISPDEQVAFLRRFLREELPVSEHAWDTAMTIMPHFEAQDGWHVQGKTGSGWLRDKKGAPDRNRPLGWFVGWAVKDERRVVFARLEVGNKPSKTYASVLARDAFLKELPQIGQDF